MSPPSSERDSKTGGGVESQHNMTICVLNSMAASLLGSGVRQDQTIGGGVINVLQAVVMEEGWEERL